MFKNREIFKLVILREVPGVCVFVCMCVCIYVGIYVFYFVHGRKGAGIGKKVDNRSFVFREIM